MDDDAEENEEEHDDDEYNVCVCVCVSPPCMRCAVPCVRSVWRGQYRDFLSG